MAAHLLCHSLSADAVPEDVEKGKGQEGAAAAMSCAAFAFCRRCRMGGGLSAYGKRHQFLSSQPLQKQQNNLYKTGKWYYLVL